MELRAAIARGDDPAAHRAAFRKLETVDELLDRFLKDYARARKRSAAEDERIFKKDVRPYIGQHKLGTVTRQDVLALANRVKDRGAGVAANRAVAALRKAFNWAKAEGHMAGENPAAGIEPRVKERSRDRVLSADEIRSFWTGLDKAKMAPGTKIALRLALLTGQRIGEICGAERVELNLSKAEWLIPGDRTKNGREHAVPLPRLAVKLFQDAVSLAGESTYVFPSRPRSNGNAAKQPLASHGVAHAMLDAREDLGLAKTPATAHDLRRTVASNLAAMGFGENVVSRLLNHSSTVNRTVTGAVYVRYDYAPEKRRALEAWADELDRIIRKRKPAADVVKLQRTVRNG
jgi:integrase